MKELTNESTAQVHEEHVVLRTVFAELAQVQSIGQTAELLNKLAALLPAHFEEEERPGGFFEHLVEAAPRAHGPVSVLKREHTVVLAKIEAMQGRLAALEAELVPQARALGEDCIDHEKRETELMTTSFFVDLGGGD